MADCELCDCCKCEDCSCPSETPDFELIINPSDLPCYPECRVPSANYADVPGGPFSKTVKACADASGIGGDKCEAKYDPSARVTFTVTNNTNRCLRVQFGFTISGIADSTACHIYAQYACDGIATDLGGNSGGRHSWFYLCLCPFSSITTCMNHRIDGCIDPCCFSDATISAFNYYFRCVDVTGCPDTGNYCDVILASCIEPPCGECCECCCLFDSCFTSMFTPCLTMGNSFDYACYPETCAGQSCGVEDPQCPTWDCPDLTWATGYNCSPDPCGVTMTKTGGQWLCSCYAGEPPICLVAEASCQYASGGDGCYNTDYSHCIIVP